MLNQPNDPGRVIHKKLMDRLISGNLQPLLDYIKNDPDLRLEVRTKGKFSVYYKKGKILEVGLRSFRVDKKYGVDSREASLAETNPGAYFAKMKGVFDQWLANPYKKDRPEFAVQQGIAAANQGRNSRYVILDMEYNFPQNAIHKDDRLKRAGFDLLGIERSSGKVVFFEVKKGLDALKNTAGIGSHILDFESFIHDADEQIKRIFRRDVARDIRNIVRQKTRLGLLDYELPRNLDMQNEDAIEFAFIFEPSESSSNGSNSEIEAYKRIFTKQRESVKSCRIYKTFLVAPDNRVIDRELC